MTLSPWSDSAVRQWKKEAEFGENNSEDSQRFLKATGYWCFFLHEAGQRRVARCHQWKHVVAQYQQEVSDDPSKALRRFGLVPESVAVLHVMADYDGALTVEDLRQLLENTASQQQIGRTLAMGRSAPSGTTGWRKEVGARPLP